MMTEGQKKTLEKKNTKLINNSIFIGDKPLVNYVEGFEKPCFSVNLRVTVNFNNFIKAM